MLDKDPNSWSAFQPTYWLLMLISIIGGFLRFADGKLSSNEKIKVLTARFWLELLFELAMSAFVGFITLFACLAMALDIYSTACIVAIGGHQGGKMFQLIFKVIEKKGFK